MLSIRETRRNGKVVPRHTVERIETSYDDPASRPIDFLLDHNKNVVLDTTSQRIIQDGTAERIANVRAHAARIELESCPKCGGGGKVSKCPCKACGGSGSRIVKNNDRLIGARVDSREVAY